MNLKRFLSFMKHTLLVVVVLTTVGISGCDDDDSGPTIFNGSIMAMIKSDQFKQSASVGADVALDSLVKFLELNDLDVILEAAPEATLFAPSNLAFQNLLALPGFPQDIRDINPDIVAGVLSYHILAEKLLINDFEAGTSYSTLYTGANNNPNDKIEINSDGTLKTGSTNQNIQIVDGDNQATNGVVHVTATVLIPQTTGASLTPILGTVAGTILLGKDFTNLAKIILSADAIFTESPGTGQFKISTWLAMPISGTTVTANIKGITFFAPPNAIPGTQILTEATADAIIAGNADKGRAFLMNHLIVSGQYTVADAPATNPNGITKFTSSQINPLSGASKKITVSVGTASATNPFGVAISNDQTVPPGATTFRPIVSKDLAHNNGQVQVFAGVLQ